MDISLKQDDGTTKTWNFDPDDLYIDEAVAIETYTGWGLVELVKNLPRVTPKGLLAIIWVLRQREEPDLDIRMVRFKIGDLSVDYDPQAEETGPKDSETPEPPAPTETS